MVEWIEAQLGLEPRLQLNLVISILILIGLWIMRGFFLRLLRRKIPDPTAYYNWQKWTQYLLYTLAILFLVSVWVPDTGNLTTYLGLVSAGLAIALKDPLTNLVGWVFILARHPFRVGDRIEIGHLAGDVIDLRLFQFSLLEIGNWVKADQSTGRVIHVPNGHVFTHAVANYSQGLPYIWNELPITITFESNWEKAKGILQHIADAHSIRVDIDSLEKSRIVEQFVIAYKHLTPIVYTNILESGVNLTVRYLCEPRKRRGSAEAIFEDILRAFAAHEDIDLAYPTQRIITS